jgi:hypothetical protein
VKGEEGDKLNFLFPLPSFCVPYIGLCHQGQRPKTVEATIHSNKLLLLAEEGPLTSREDSLKTPGDEVHVGVAGGGDAAGRIRMTGVQTLIVAVATSRGVRLLVRETENIRWG